MKLNCSQGRFPGSFNTSMVWGMGPGGGAGRCLQRLGWTREAAHDCQGGHWGSYSAMNHDAGLVLVRHIQMHSPLASEYDVMEEISSSTASYPPGWILGEIPEIHRSKTRFHIISMHVPGPKQQGSPALPPHPSISSLYAATSSLKEHGSSDFMQSGLHHDTKTADAKVGGAKVGNAPK